MTNKRKPNITHLESEERRWSLYTEHLKQAWEGIDSGSKSFEQSLLAVSSGALGASLAFIKDIVPLKQAIWMRLLYGSWISFALCIAVTIFAAPLTIAAQGKHIDYLYKYYIEQKEDYFDRRSGYSRVLSIAIWIAAVLFLVGLASTVVFCIRNIMK
jgi:hypothetical protein